MLRRLMTIAMGSGKTDINYLIYPNRRIYLIPIPTEFQSSGLYRVTKHDGNLYLCIEKHTEVRSVETYAEIQTIEESLK